jgi:hypothetical protein
MRQLQLRVARSAVLLKKRNIAKFFRNSMPVPLLLLAPAPGLLLQLLLLLLQLIPPLRPSDSESICRQVPLP